MIVEYSTLILVPKIVLKNYRLVDFFPSAGEMNALMERGRSENVCVCVFLCVCVMCMCVYYSVTCCLYRWGYTQYTV